MEFDECLNRSQGQVVTCGVCTEKEFINLFFFEWQGGGFKLKYI